MHNDYPHTQLEINIKPQIDYPCTWGYRIIGFKKERILEAIESVFGGKAEISPTEHVSSHHKYVAINCSVQVQNDEERLQYFNGLVEQDGILMVL
ncbi:hypothetical protein CQA53_09315 [Helicobacter didelphidarum]|uniref:DUF493 domain-containing protein n=1 Tax=Helicobacter didelphidarum TaxID=2040648 RepID=A0A3D8IBB8_9HELI|nr:DUF493 domain-containing protein [Helicobacter didelphidarum]RDU62483.1 hypothetical protein CQA53_09315 [Helicobacter didelphidarum]